MTAAEKAWNDLGMGVVMTETETAVKAMVGGREVFHVAVGDSEYTLYSEPTYGDECYIEDNKIVPKYEIGEDGKTVKSSGVVMVSVRLLRLERALSGVTRAQVERLPARVARELNKALDATEWQYLAGK